MKAKTSQGNAEPKYVQRSLFPERVCSAHLVASDSPKSAFYRIWIEADAGVFTVRKESGIKNRVLDRRAWPFGSMDEAKKSYNSRIKSKTNPHRKSPRKYTLLAMLFMLLLPSMVLAWSGECVGVADGDTITVLKDSKPVKIRLYGVDCPEKRQAFGARAKQFTADKVFRNIVEIKPVDQDRYGRIVAWVIVGGQNLNQSLVEAGLAWHYKRYSSDRTLAELEEQARKARAGIWSDPRVVAPWTFRKQGTKHKNESPTDARTGVYHGNSESRIFHKPTCKHYNCKNCTVVFKNRADAIIDGYKPCGICKP